MKFKKIIRYKDIKWLLFWTSTIFALLIWDIMFLNKPALKLVAAGFFNTFIISFLVIIITLIFGWSAAISLHFLQSGKSTPGCRIGYLALTFLINLVRSIPQIVGILFGYVWIAYLIKTGAIQHNPSVFLLMACVMSLFIFIEMADLIRERIEHFQNMDFCNSMRVCGISENRIINYEILWKNSRIHIFNKIISIFGMTVFLQSSVDFIISVGLSRQISSISMPSTLGSLLAKIDSKQDILALGYSITNPGYAGRLFFEHLQGISAAFLMVFSLVCIYQIANGFAERHRL